ncbi:MAG: beta-aspartyl-peptidase (threonine type) [Chlamydiales bacterium]|jgi:beta-aspartyl-peptidase (threonine type)
MHVFQHAILTHGGAGSDPIHSDGPELAATAGINLMKGHGTSLDAVIHAVTFLEDDPRFNAGTGSQIRADQHTIQMDAACMTSDGNFGAVACVEGIQNPIALAQEVLRDSSCILISGEGALIFAKEKNLTLKTPNATTQHKTTNTASCDTVGAVAFDGTSFAAALSSGGLKNAPLGRVGDVPLPGCGLFCGPIAAIACTGDGEFIALKILAREVYSWLEQGMEPNDAAEKALSIFEDSVDIGLIILTKNAYALKSRNGMASSHQTDIR